MSERQDDSTDTLDLAVDEDGRRQLWFRAAAAGGLIALLLGGLSVFDYLSRPPKPVELALPSKPIAPPRISEPEVGRDVPPDVLRAGAESPSEPPPEETTEESAPPALPEDESPLPERRTAAPARPVSRAQPSSAPVEGSSRPGRVMEAPRESAQAPLPRGASPVLAAAAGGGSVSAAPPGVTARAPGVTPATLSNGGAGRVGADSTPVAPALASAAVREPALAGVQTSSRAYALQFGHFSSFQAAEEVRARLAQAGMPARVEARVVVGPFADRIQAEQAQSRLKEKGLDAGALIILAR